MEEDPSDDQLLARARTGDASAIEALLERFQRRVYGFSMRMCGDETDAEDVLQETLLTAARSLPTFKGDSSFSTWLYTVARSFCIKQRRRGKFAPEHELSLATDVPREGPLVVDPGRTPEMSVETRELGAALDEALAYLDPDQREVLLLRDVEGLTAPEVGKVLGVSAEAVKSRLHRARAAVRQRLVPLLGVLEAPADSCPPVLTLYSQHLEGEISADLCRDIEQHLSGCRRCTAACDSLRRILTVCSTAPTPAVPARVQASVREAIRQVIRGAPLSLPR